MAPNRSAVFMLLVSLVMAILIKYSISTICEIIPEIGDTVWFGGGLRGVLHMVNLCF